MKRIHSICFLLGTIIAILAIPVGNDLQIPIIDKSSNRTAQLPTHKVLDKNKEPAFDKSSKRTLAIHNDLDKDKVLISEEITNHDSTIEEILGDLNIDLLKSSYRARVTLFNLYKKIVTKGSFEIAEKYQDQVFIPIFGLELFNLLEIYTWQMNLGYKRKANKTEKKILAFLKDFP